MDIIEHGAADQLFRPIAEHALDRWALVEDAAGGIDGRDGIRAPFDERPEAFLTGPQRTRRAGAPGRFSCAPATMSRHSTRRTRCKDTGPPLGSRKSCMVRTVTATKKAQRPARPRTCR